MAAVPPTPIFPIRLPPELKARLQALAQAQKRSLANLIVVALEEWLAEYERRQQL